jgi:hypothetical protein
VHAACAQPVCAAADGGALREQLSTEKLKPTGWPASAGRRRGTQGKDSYGRTLGLLTVDGLLINERLVAEGHAWSQRGKSGQGPYMAKEKVAIALKRGLHATRGAVAPWDFRRSNGRCGDAAPAASVPTAARPPAPLPPARVAEAQGFRCDGRTHCAQMRSCAEATYFLTHCPGVAMDGNGDGIPCERQWCR